MEQIRHILLQGNLLLRGKILQMGIIQIIFFWSFTLLKIIFIFLPTTLLCRLSAQTDYPPRGIICFMRQQYFVPFYIWCNNKLLDILTPVSQIQYNNLCITHSNFSIPVNQGLIYCLYHFPNICSSLILYSKKQIKSRPYSAIKFQKMTCSRLAQVDITELTKL